MDNKNNKPTRDRLPFKRKLIQLYAALLFNANIKGFFTGEIYTGPLKNICNPGLNCYSCPGAVGACPLGALQNALASSTHTIPFYMFGIIMLYGLLFGRWICGFLCPFGLIQELLHKIPTPKIKKGKITRIISYIKYFILAVFVGIIPLAYAFRSFPLPAFCKYICPAGTLEGAMGLLSNSVNEGYLRMLGPIFTWKFLLMISFIVLCVFIFRCFCRFICPLGALYGFFNKIALVGVTVDQKSCTDCGICVGKCKMDIKKVGDHECIACGECISSCPTNAISFKGSKFIIKPSVAANIPENIDETEKNKILEDVEKQNIMIAERNQKVTKKIKTVAAIIMCVVLIVTICFTNGIFDGIFKVPASETEETTPITQETESTEVGDDETTDGSETNGDSESESDSESETETDKPKPPVGIKKGNTCPDISLDIIGSDTKFSVQQNSGKVTVLNFWFTTCGPCLHELPYFYEVSQEYADSITVIAVHIEQKNVNVTSFINNSSGHPEWNDGSMLIGWDTGKQYQSLFKIQACPVTVIIDGDGIITYNEVGGMTKDELVKEIENALN